jgi:ubiquinone/menaquinone biosynthesis C-methylase UbiE
MDKYTTSQGHNFSTSAWLDLHFDACKLEYENMVRSVGVKPGWKVLEAGCGNGRFLDIIAKLITSSGEISAIDLAQENIDEVENLVKSNQFNVPVSASVGDVTSLDFPDNSFDLVWCANVTQYLDETNLSKAINEFKRVLKPNGTVAIKETDGTSYFFYPTKNVTLLWDSIKPMSQFDKQRWFIHPLQMKSLLEQHGFTSTRQSTQLIDRRFPLDEKTKKYLSKLFELEDVNWSAIDQQTPENQEEWNKLLNKDSPEYILSQPDFFWREGHILAMGNK